ncbi:MAG: T9SS type A sorting domain-containing protein [Saprospiraceae bacterium]|nr:T9SS type A sorting domain-containing protein [Saprospiraceae bacterium]
MELDVPIPSSADIDGDGDVDVFVNDYYGNSIHFYENLAINVSYPPTSADNSIIMPEDGIYLFQPDDISFADGNLSDQLQAVQITALPTLGLLKIGSTAANVNDIIQVAQLPNLIFDPDLNEFGPDYANFKFKVSDGGLWSVDDYTMTINVTPVNDAPFFQDAEVTASNDFPYVFEAADFPYTDVENQPFDDLNILTLPAKGSLTLAGNAVTAGQNVPAAQVGELSYSAIAGEFGAAYTSFDFQVSDGSAFSTISTMTINVLETSGSKDRTLQATVNLSPNPVSDLLNIHLESVKPLANPTITVYDALGRNIISKQLNGELQILDYQLNVSQMAAGFYFVKIEADGKTSLTKFVKK